MSQEVHHGIEDDTRRGMLLIDILRQLHNAIRLTTQAPYGSGIVQCIARNGETIDTPEGNGSLTAEITFYRSLPSQRIQPIDQKPHTNNRYQPISGMAQVLP